VVFEWYRVGCGSEDDVFGRNVSGWIKDPGGVTTGGWGLTMAPRDMARFGFLYLNHGRWDGRAIVPAAWVAESTAPNPNDYGYYWWLRGSGRTLRPRSAQAATSRSTVTFPSGN
jgi:CubicO group peptidase (beta-lactamase class C family)